MGDSSRSRPARERPGDKVSDNRHRQRRTPANTHGRRRPRVLRRWQPATQLGFGTKRPGPRSSGGSRRLPPALPRTSGQHCDTGRTRTAGGRQRHAQMLLLLLCIAELSRIRSRRRRYAAPLARRQRRRSAAEGPRGARRATPRGSPDQHSSFVTQMDALPAVLSPAGSSATPVHPNGRLRLRTAGCPECCARRGKGGWWKRDSMRELFTTGGCHDRRLLQYGQAAGALARATAGGAILARSPARTQRPRRHALRALRPS